eukprot:NODE_2034_length_1709_cov_49.604035_g1739_i0.p1 GENE.NODE_2034_length_1709_cov_49.604035_g1739_i0~~NODE_2034_length_1709_cov_49.604035_g1739_i0.p1  ORF type:complete len:524 (+),score=85.70 NODE_2034_length_1709_cov_49.604035_g1739_i0:66-1637(+)
MTTLVKQLENELTCVACNNLLQDPLASNCPHCFCRTCIEQQVEDVNKQYSCPKCNTTIYKDRLHSIEIIDKILNIFKAPRTENRESHTSDNPDDTIDSSKSPEVITSKYTPVKRKSSKQTTLVNKRKRTTAQRKSIGGEKIPIPQPESTTHTETDNEDHSTLSNKDPQDSLIDIEVEINKLDDILNKLSTTIVDNNLDGLPYDIPTISKPPDQSTDNTVTTTRPHRGKAQRPDISDTTTTPPKTNRTHLTRSISNTKNKTEAPTKSTKSNTSDAETNQNKQNEEHTPKKVKREKEAPNKTPSPTDSLPHKTRSKIPMSGQYAIMCSTLNEQQKCVVEQACRTLGGIYVDNIQQPYTHLITNVLEGNIANRTIKYVLGIAAGVWIINFDWIKDSLAAGEWKAEEPYEVQGDHFSREGPYKGRMARQKGQKILSGYKVFFYGSWSQPAGPPKSELQLLSERCGATVIEENVLIELMQRSRNVRKLIIFVPKVADIQYAKELGLGDVVVSRWLLDSLSRFQLMPIP